MPEATNKIQDYFVRELTRGWLDLATAERINQLIEWLKTNKVTETTVTGNGTGDRPEVDAYEKKELSELLKNEAWRRAISDDGVRALETFLGIVRNGGHDGQGHDAPGTVPMGSIPGNLSTRVGSMGRVKLDHLTALFNQEYASRKRQLFEKAGMSDEERGKNLLYLLEDYARVLNAAGDGPEVAVQRRELLKAYFQKPAAKVYGAADPDDDFLATAWEIVWGTDPERAENRFQVDDEKKWYAYMSMNGEFTQTAKKIDAYLRATNQPASVEAFEKKSPLNWIVGEEPGNTKASWSFEESRAIASTGVDFAVKLLPSDAEVGTRTLEPSFDLKVDFYAWNEFVRLDAAAGDKLVALRENDQAELKVSVENVDADHWRPVFTDAQGAVVPREQVIAVVKDSAGQVKGDGKTDGSYSASWWGFCDRNAMQNLVTMKYGFPKPQKAVTLKVGDQSFEFSQDDVIKIVGRRLTEVFPQETQAGNRNDGQPDEVHLKGGKVLYGKINSEVNFYTPDTYRTGDNMALVPKGADAPRGTLLIKKDDGTTQELEVGKVKEIQRQSGSPLDRVTKDTIVLTDGSTVSGSLASKVSFAGAVSANGARVLANSEAKPILGDLVMTTTHGDSQRIAMTDIEYMVREDQNEILADEALAYIIRNQGIFAADSSTSSMVANGVHTIDAIRRWRPGQENKPEWVSADLKALSGYKGRVQDETKLVFLSLDYKESSWSGLKFWLEMDDNNNPINCGMVSGQWDFLWGVAGQPNWDAKATFNPNMPNDLVLKLYINSLEHPDEAEKVLPSNWRTYLQS